MAIESLLRVARNGTLLSGGRTAIVDGYVVAEGGDITGPPGTILEPLDGGLLVVEEFARLDIDDHEALAAWVSRRGPLLIDNPFANPRQLKEPSRVRRSPMLREDFLARIDALPTRYGPWPGFEIFVRSGVSIERIKKEGYIADEIVTIRAHWEQVNDWLPVLVDIDPDSFSVRLRDVRLPVTGEARAPFTGWLLGQNLQTVVTDALDFIVVDKEEPDDDFDVVASWVSVLQPIYLQIFMAWRRARQQLPAAARCRECEQVFLILDGRRSTYCNAKCRNRFNVRAFRDRAKEAAES